MRILADTRWIGSHGIGRFANEVIARLDNVSPIGDQVAKLSLRDLWWISQEIKRHQPDVYFSPGFNPPLYSRVPFVFTVHDLIHLHVKEEANLVHQLYYAAVVKPALLKANRVLTVSEYSKQQLLIWQPKLAEDRVVVVGNGVSSEFTVHGERHQPGYAYIFYVGNRKAHKNIDRLLQAMRAMPSDIKLLMSGEPDASTEARVRQLGLDGQVVFAGFIPEESLGAYYRGAVLTVMPSLYEGFGLPALESMACGTPVVVANTTSLPEVVGEAGILVDPYSPEAIAEGMTCILHSSSLQQTLKEKGLTQARQFSWDKAADKVKTILENLCA